jgi:hypothetical protein
MAAYTFKWLLLTLPLFFTSPPHPNVHPFFVSVAEIEHNAADKTLEISCKIFTDDLEQTLRLHHTQKIDVLNPALKKSMGAIIAGYIQQHLRLSVNASVVNLKFLGYEQQQEAIVSFFEVENISPVKKIAVFNNLLYESKPQQMSIIHVTVNGSRKSTKLVNPETDASFEF